MRRALALALVLSAGCFAGGMGFGGFRGGGFGGFRGGGFGGFRGGGVGGFRGGILGGFHGGSFGGFRSGFAGRGNFSAFFPGGFRTRGYGHGFRRFGYGYGYPYWGAYPAFWSYYDPFYDPFSYESPEPVYYPQTASPAPQVIVIAPQIASAAPAPPPAPRSSFSEPPAPQEAAPAPPTAAPGSGPIYFLVPFKNKSVQAAVAYWIEGSTLHYITVSGAEQQAPLSDIDRDAAARINRGRIIRFRLPPEK